MPWFVRPDGTGDPVLVPEWMPDTLVRLRGEGWAEIPDPRAQARHQAAPDHIADAGNMIDSDPAETQARLDEAKVEQVKAVKARNTAARKWVERKA